MRPLSALVVVALLAACRQDSTFIAEPNRGPSAPLVAIEPDAPTTDDPLRAVLRAPALDPDGDAVSYRYVWYRDGALAPEHTAEVVPASATSKGERWAVTAIPSDGRLDGTAGSAETLVRNRPPTATVALAPADPRTADDLVATWTTADGDGDPVTVTVAWLREGVPMPGLDGATVPAAATRRGELWTVLATPDDGDQPGETVQASLTVGNTPPVATAIAVSPRLVTPRDTLTATVSAEDADDDPVSHRFAWYVDGVEVGEDAATLDLGAWTVGGEEVQVLATPTDGTDGGAPIASATIPVYACLLGRERDCPATSCLAILDSGLGDGDGAYWLDGDGDEGAAPFRAWCDLTGGGWTLLGKQRTAPQGTPVIGRHVQGAGIDLDPLSSGYASIDASSVRFEAFRIATDDDDRTCTLASPMTVGGITHDARYACTSERYSFGPGHPGWGCGAGCIRRWVSYGIFKHTLYLNYEGAAGFGESCANTGDSDETACTAAAWLFVGPLMGGEAVDGMVTYWVR